MQSNGLCDDDADDEDALMPTSVNCLSATALVHLPDKARLAMSSTSEYSTLLKLSCSVSLLPPHLDSWLLCLRIRIRAGGKKGGASEFDFFSRVI